MDIKKIEAALKKLQYQVRILSEAIDYKQKPTEALILQMDWNEGEISKVHDIFEKWDDVIEVGGAFNRIQFESDFDAIDIHYQALKSVILAFYRNNQWTAVCEAYVDSFQGKPAMEYHSIMRRERS